MDVLCPRCAEPWDNDTFHDAAKEQNTTYAKVTADFRVRGCIAVGWQEQPCVAENSLRTQAASVMYELLGDDMDGAAAMLEDFEYAGMLDE